MASDPAEGPRPTGKPEELIELVGRLFAWDDGQPVLLRFTGCDDLFLPLFSSESALRVALADVSFESIKRVDDGVAFLASLPLMRTTAGGLSLLRVIADLRLVPETGRWRFLEIDRAEAMA